MKHLLFIVVSVWLVSCVRPPATTETLKDALDEARVLSADTILNDESTISLKLLTRTQECLFMRIGAKDDGVMWSHDSKRWVTLLFDAELSQRLHKICSEEVIFREKREDRILPDWTSYSLKRLMARLEQK